jgi:transposase
MDCAFLSIGKRGAKAEVAIGDIVRIILHRLKTGVQWRFLPVKAFLDAGAITWNGVYYHYSKWVKDGSFQKAWTAILKAHKALLALSFMQPDGSHTPAKGGGENIGYQGRKAAKTTNGAVLCG